jgi:hypothetical protein
VIRADISASQLLVAAAMIAMPASADAAGTSGFSRSSLASQFPARVLAVHQAERARVSAPMLVWDDNLGNGAAIYAAQMAITNRFEHSQPKLRPGVGENLWMGTRGSFTPEQMVRAWASEQRKFVPGIFPNVARTGRWSDVGHYTQMIWPTTTRLGCALASNGRTDYLVCRYSSPGNIRGGAVGLSHDRPRMLATKRAVSGEEAI